jgi:curved DNA-binding protein CbpA
MCSFATAQQPRRAMATAPGQPPCCSCSDSEASTSSRRARPSCAAGRVPAHALVAAVFALLLLAQPLSGWLLPCYARNEHHSTCVDNCPDWAAVRRAADAARGKGATKKPRDFYAILGLDKDADEHAIKKAYRKQALKWWVPRHRSVALRQSTRKSALSRSAAACRHPDRNPDKKEQAEDKFKDIAAAYETLSDADKRRTYDQFGEDGMQGGAGSGAGAGGQRFRYEVRAWAPPPQWARRRRLGCLLGLRPGLAEAALSLRVCAWPRGHAQRWTRLAHDAVTRDTCLLSLRRRTRTRAARTRGTSSTLSSAAAWVAAWAAAWARGAWPEERAACSSRPAPAASQVGLVQTQRSGALTTLMLRCGPACACQWAARCPPRRAQRPDCPSHLRRRRHGRHGRHGHRPRQHGH